MALSDRERLERRKEVTRRYRERNRERVRKVSRESKRKIYKLNKEKGMCVECGKHKIAVGNKALCSTCSSVRNKYYTEEIANKRKLERKALKEEMVKEFGGKCVCCGEKNIEFLTLDHIDGGGTQERLILKRGGTTFYSWLKKLGWPKEGLRLLCFNCNCSLGCYGYCPHKK